MDEFTFQLNSPITDEQRNTITDAELERSNEIEFATPSGKKVVFRKVKRGKWTRLEYDTFNCNLCGTTFILMQGMSKMNYCPNCGAKMRKDDPSHPLVDSDDIYGG